MRLALLLVSVLTAYGQESLMPDQYVERDLPADEVGDPVSVSLRGSQLAPEDIIGVPQIVDGCSRFCPPVSIARKSPY